MILLDTSVLVYALGTEHPLRDASRRVVEAAVTVRVTTALVVIQEFLHVFGLARPRHVAADAARSYAIAFEPLLAPDADDLGLAVELYERHTRLEAFDALLAATALNREVAALVTADRAFADVPGLRALDPRAPELIELLG